MTVDRKATRTTSLIQGLQRLGTPRWLIGHRQYALVQQPPNAWRQRTPCPRQCQHLLDSVEELVLHEVLSCTHTKHTRIPPDVNDHRNYSRKMIGTNRHRPMTSQHCGPRHPRKSQELRWQPCHRNVLRELVSHVGSMVAPVPRDDQRNFLDWCCSGVTCSQMPT